MKCRACRLPRTGKDVEPQGVGIRWVLTMVILRNWLHPWISIKQRYMEAAIFEISFKENEEEAMTMTRRSHEYRCCKVIVDEDGWNKVKDQ